MNAFIGTKTDRPAPAKDRKRRKRLFSIDHLLVLIGFGVAAGAALLPWYAVIGGHGLGINNDGLLRLSGHRDDMAGYGVSGSIRPFGPKADIAEATDGLADLTTGSIPAIQQRIEAAKKDHKMEEQPFPGRPFHVVHVINGQALIADDAGMYLVSVGSALPDNSTLKSFTKKDGHWALVTSNGDVVGR